MAVYNIIEGQTVPVNFQLLENGAPINLTAITVNLLLSDSEGNTITPSGNISIIDAVNGKVSFLPTNSSVFVASKGPYFARWQLSDASNNISFCPTADRDTWAIFGQ